MNTFPLWSLSFSAHYPQFTALVPCRGEPTSQVCYPSTHLAIFLWPPLKSCSRSQGVLAPIPAVKTYEIKKRSHADSLNSSTQEVTSAELLRHKPYFLVNYPFNMTWWNQECDFGYLRICRSLRNNVVTEWQITYKHVWSSRVKRPSRDLEEIWRLREHELLLLLKIC